MKLADGATQTWVTLTRTGSFTDPRYGEFAITPDMLGQMVSNIDARVLGNEQRQSSARVALDAHSQ